MTVEAYIPDAKTIARRKADGKTPGGSEASINWEDSDDALANLRGDVANAKYGVLRLSILDLKYANASPGNENGLSWERAPLERPRPNPYHGNIVFADRLLEPQIFELASILAIKSKFLPPPPDSETVG